MTVNNFATDISAGPGDESGQTLTFTVNVTNTTGNLAFTTSPEIDSSGNLTYSVTAGTTGTATVSVVLTDSGSNISPSVNVSSAQTFTITVNPSGEGEAGGSLTNDLALLYYLAMGDNAGHVADSSSVPDDMWLSRRRRSHGPAC